MTDSSDYPFDEIEALIDRHGLARVLRAIEAFCKEAEYTAIERQDIPLARQWNGVAGIVGRGAACAEMEMVSP